MCCDVNSHIQSIEDYVFVEEKIVTFRWLSQRLNVHTNTAKQILYSFSKRDSKEPLLVTYVITGSLKTGKGFKVLLVKESDLDKGRSFFSEINSEHVYSVQKAPSSNVKSQDLFLADSEYSSYDISLSSIGTRSIPEREFKIIIPDKPKDVLIKAKEAPAKVNAIGAFSKGKTDKNSSNDSEANKKNHPEDTEKKNNATSHDTVKPKSPVKVSPKKTGKKNDKKNVPKGGGIGAFFSKQSNAAKPPEKTKQNEPIKEIKEPASKISTSPKAEKKTDNTKKEDGDNKEPKKEEIKEAKQEKEKPILSKKKTSQNKKRKKAHEDDSNKKRKRIMLASDSESSNDEMEVEEEFYEEPPPPAPAAVESDEEIVPPTPVAEKGRKRIRKEIDRNYEDEDGYILTKKEYVYESCSDDEESNKVKLTEDKTNDQESAKKKENTSSENKHEEKENNVSAKNTKTKTKSPKQSISPNKNKQASIMSFFKKK